MSFLKRVIMTLAGLIVVGAGVMAWAYITFCGGHPHGVC